MLGLLDMESVDRRHTQETFTSQHIRQWIRSKYRKHVIFFILWFLSRLILALAFIVFDNTLVPVEERIADPEVGDMDTCLQRTTSLIIQDRSVVAILAFYLILHSFLGLIFDVWDIINAHKRDLARDHVTCFRTIKGAKRLVVDYWTYRVSQCLINAGVLLNVIVRMLRYEYQFGASVMASSFLHLIILTNIAASFVFFLQLVPKIGFYAVVIQRMSFSVYELFLHPVPGRGAPIHAVLRQGGELWAGGV